MRHAPAPRRSRLTLALAGLIGVPLLLLALAAGAVWLALERQPAIAEVRAVNAEDVARVYALLKVHAPDRPVQPGLIKSAPVSARDLELLLAEAGRRLGREIRPQARFEERRALVDLSMPAPGPLAGHWLNLHVALAQGTRLPEVASVRLGRLPLPAPLLLWAAGRLIEGHRMQPPLMAVLQGVHQVSFAPDIAAVAYAYTGKSVNQALADALLPAAQQGRLKVYVQRLTAFAMTPRPRGAPPGVTPLSQVLPPLLQLAQRRAAQGGAHAGSLAEEHRAAMLALTLLANPGALHKLLPSSKTWGPVPVLHLTLRGRDDFPLHFMVSAVIAAEGGGPLADAVGLYKEIKDSQGGSGFSFNDIAADRAGTRFGLLAAKSPDVLQQRMRPGMTDDAFLPPVEDLPEFLTAAEFHRRYGDTDSPTYRAMQADIEQRLDGLPLLAAP